MSNADTPDATAEIAKRSVANLRAFVKCSCACRPDARLLTCGCAGHTSRCWISPHGDWNGTLRHAPSIRQVQRNLVRGLVTPTCGISSQRSSPADGRPVQQTTAHRSTRKTSNARSCPATVATALARRAFASTPRFELAPNRTWTATATPRSCLRPRRCRVSAIRDPTTTTPDGRHPVC